MDAICRVFLPQRIRTSDAITAAEMELRAIKKIKISRTTKLRALEQKKNVKNIPPFSFFEYSPLSLFLDLLEKPEFALEKFKEKCEIFGKERILKAVAYGGPYTKDISVILTNFSSKLFGKTSRYSLLEKFHAVGNKESMTWYAWLNLKNWTELQLINLVEDKGLSQLPIGAEFLRRKLPAEALTYAFMLQDDVTATAASIALLSSSEAAERNIIHVLSSWEKGKPSMSKYLRRTPSALLALSKKALICPYFPVNEMMSMLMCFGPSVTAFMKIFVPNGLGDETALRLLVDHNHQLRQCLEQRLLRENQNSCIGPGDSVENGRAADADTAADTCTAADAAVDAATARAISGPKRSDGKKAAEWSRVWTCDVCRVRQFKSYDEAVAHETECLALQQHQTRKTLLKKENDKSESNAGEEQEVTLEMNVEVGKVYAKANEERTKRMAEMRQKV